MGALRNPGRIRVSPTIQEILLNEGAVALRYAGLILEALDRFRGAPLPRRGRQLARQDRLFLEDAGRCPQGRLQGRRLFIEKDFADIGVSHVTAEPDELFLVDL